MKRQIGWVFAATAALIAPATAQDGTAERSSQGTLIGTTGGAPRYQEDSGWNSPNFNDPQWAVRYGSELGNGDPWTVVLQQDRTNAAFTTSANKLTLDLNGFEYKVLSYVEDHNFYPALLRVYDANDDGAYLRVTNGVLRFQLGQESRMDVGTAGFAGLLKVDHGAVIGSQIHVGAAAGSPGKIILGESGELSTTDISLGLVIGDLADGQIVLDGAGSQIDSQTIRIGNASQSALGMLTVANPDALVTADNIFVDNPAPMDMMTHVGLRINAGRVVVNNILDLANNSGDQYGAVLIDGGMLDVNGDIKFGEPDGLVGVTGGKVFLNSGTLAVTNAVHPEKPGQFYWKAGTLRYEGVTNLFLTRQQVVSLTKQGAITYGGDRAAGVIATGQTLAFDGDATFYDGTVGLAGGTIKTGGTLDIYGDANGRLAGYGTVDAVVVGTGEVVSDHPSEALSLGALGGSNTLSGVGEFRVGHLNTDASFAGTATGSGGFYKVGTGTQTITGSLANSGGLFIEGGTLAFDGTAAQMNVSNINIAAGGTLAMLSDSTGQVTGGMINAGDVLISGGTLIVNGGITNDGWLTNNGTLGADITGSGGISGSGTFTGDVNIVGGSILAPGNSVGTIHADNLTLGLGGRMDFEIDSALGLAGVNWDLTTLTGTLTVLASASNPFVIAITSLNGAGTPGLLSNFDPLADYSWKFLDATISNPSQINSDQFLIDISQLSSAEPLTAASFSVSGKSDGLYLNYHMRPAAVPEPSSWLLLLGAALILAESARRRRMTTARC